MCKRQRIFTIKQMREHNERKSTTKARRQNKTKRNKAEQSKFEPDYSSNFSTKRIDSITAPNFENNLFHLFLSRSNHLFKLSQSTRSSNKKRELTTSTRQRCNPCSRSYYKAYRPSTSWKSRYPPRFVDEGDPECFARI